MADVNLVNVEELTDFDYMLIVKGTKVAKVSAANAASKLGGLIGINDTWLRFRDVISIESQDKLDSMQYSGIYLLTQPSELEYVRNCILVVIGNPNICCVQKLYNYNGSIYKYRVKWYSNYWDNW
jgi:hypothetical protein